MKGLGVILKGDDGTDAVRECLGLPIVELTLERDEVVVRLGGGRRLVLSDEGQSCCESRYITTDDDLGYLTGSVLTGVEVLEAPGTEEGGSYHECQFLKVRTSLGAATFVTHNEHNGYYGGFSIQARVK